MKQENNLIKTQIEKKKQIIIHESNNKWRCKQL